MVKAMSIYLIERSSTVVIRDDLDTRTRSSDQVKCSRSGAPVLKRASDLWNEKIQKGAVRTLVAENNIKRW